LPEWSFGCCSCRAWWPGSAACLEVVRVDAVEAEVARWAGTRVAGFRVSGVVRRTGLPKREVFRCLMRLVARRVLALRWQLSCPECLHTVWEGRKFPEVCCVFCGCWEGSPEPGMWQPVFYYRDKAG